MPKFREAALIMRQDWEDALRIEKIESNKYTRFLGQLS